MSKRNTLYCSIKILSTSFAHAHKRTYEDASFNNYNITPRRARDTLQQSFDEVILHHQLSRYALFPRSIADERFELHCILSSHNNTPR